MSIKNLEKQTPEAWDYALRDKLWGHIKLRSELAFEKAKQTRKNISTIEELERYNLRQKKLFIEALGGIPYDSSLPLNAKTVGTVVEDDLVIEKVVFESRPGVFVTANLYLPKKRKKSAPAVLFQAGHTDSSKADMQYQRVVRTIASCGIIVLIMDPVGQGERHGYYEESINSDMVASTVWEHTYAGDQCVLIGDNIARYFIADAMRAVDYLQSRSEVDPDKIGATGSSGGGTATCYVMLCDDRIKAAAPATFVTTRQQYIYAGGAQDSEQIWYGATRDGFDHYEFFMAFAPKPALILAVDRDFFPIEGAQEVIDTVKPFYKMYGAEEKLMMKTDDSLHKYTDNLAKYAAEFFSLYLGAEKCIADESAAKSIDKTLLNCTKSGYTKLDYSSKFVFDENLERFESLPKKDNLKEFLTEKMNFERTALPVKPRINNPVYERGIKSVSHFWFAHKLMPNCGMLLSDFRAQPKEVVICLWDNATDSLEEHWQIIRSITDEGKAAFVVELSGMGKCAPHALNTSHADKAQYGVFDRLTKDLFFLGDSLCAIRLFELNYIVKELCPHLSLKPSVYAEGMCAAYARLLGELDDNIEITLHSPCKTYDEIVRTKYYDDYNIYGILLPGIANYIK